MSGPDVGGIFDMIFGITLIGIVASLLVPIAVIAVIVWAIRRAAPAMRDPAEQALRDRLARGEDSERTRVDPAYVRGLEREVAELRMERDVLKRSVVLWVKEATR